MARKDVDLVIRAKDEAENVVRAITKALNEFNDSQKATAIGSERTDSALGKLGASYADLKKAIGGASVGAKIADEMNRADAAVSRLESSTAKVRDELAGMKTEVSAAEASLAKLTAETAKQAKAQTDQTKAVQKSKGELSALRAEINTLEQATKGLVTQQTKLPEAIAKQEAAIAKTSARLDELNLAYAAAEKPGKTLTAQIGKANDRLAGQTAKLADLKAELTGLGAKLTTTGESMSKLAQKAAAAEAALSKQTADLASIKKGYADTSAAARTAAQSQIAAATSVEKLTAKLATEETQLETAKAALVELGKAAGLSEAELAKLTDGSLTRLQGILAKQKAILAGAKEQFASLSAAAAELENRISQAGVPTRKMSEDFAVLKAQVAGSAAILSQARVAFTEMSQSFRTGEKDLNGLEVTEKSFVATQAQMSDAIKKTTAAYERNVAAIRALHQEQAKGSGSRGPSSPPPVPVAPPVGPWNKLSEAFNRLYGDSRKSLSLTQRLRGEVLSLIAAYGGFYGVVNLLGQVLGAYQKLEAAQARLNVANNGDIAKSAEDMDFLRRNADRLGVDLGTLAQEYSKFSIATLGTNLAGEKTRKIFLSVAEAARVNRSTNEELSGVFVALTQIVSKGAVQMEELRQQLGDRLPGALQIMADGLNVTTAELIKMMEAGEVTSDALVPFAEELDKRFGPGLGEALAGTTVALGRLKNAAFQALVGFGEGGFIESFTQLANKLTTLMQSADFAAFVSNASAAFAVLIDALSVLVDNFQLVIAAAAGFAGLKLAPLLIGIAIGFKEIVVASKTAVAAQIAVRAALGSTGGAASAAAVGMTAFRAAATALLSSTGIGLAITAIAAGIGYWAASADEASAAMDRHKEVVDKVKNAYDAAAGSVETWRKNLDDLTVTEARRDLKDLEAAALETADAFQNIGVRGDFRGAFNVTNEQKIEVDKLRDSFLAGVIDSKKFIAGIDAVNQKYDDGSDSAQYYADKVIESAKAFAAAQDAAAQARDIIVAMTGDLELAQKAFDKIAGKATDAGTAIDAGFKAAMDALGKSVQNLADMAPKTKSGIEEVAAAADELQKNYNEALRAARALPDAIMRAAAEQAAFNGLAAGAAAVFSANQEVIDGGFGGSIVDRIIGVESGGNPAAKNPNSTATGLGQFIESTWLDLFKRHFPDRAASMTDGMILALREDAALSRQMVELYLRENAQHLQKAGIAITDANLYLTHFLGAGGASKLLGSAPGTVANDVLDAGQVSANASILDGKTREEIIAWAQRKVGISNEELQIQETLIANDQKSAEEAAKEAERRQKEHDDAMAATQETLADGEFAIRQQELANRGLERQAAIESAIREAKKENSAITDEQIAKVAEHAGRVYDLANAEKDALKPKEAAQKAEEAANNLLAQRNALQEQFNIAKEQGDAAGQDRLKGEIASVNQELISAIENAKAMWSAVGGQEADAAIAKLEATRLAAVHVGEVAKVNYLEWDKLAGLFVDGLAGAFDSFAKQIADGVKPLEALRNSFLQFASDFLLQIAQMIIKQAIFNALSKAFGGTSFGSLIGLGHTGGTVGSQRVGSGNQSRRVSPAIFAGAPRYHQGGVVGLRPGEVPIIAQEGERILTEAEDKALGKTLAGAGQASAPDPKVRVVNGIDSASFLEAALASPAGEKVILNWLRANSNAVSGSRG